MRQPGIGRSATLGVLLLGLAGCGEEAPGKLPLAPTSGRVLVDGEPAAGVEVRFRPADAPDSLDALVPFGTTGEDGGYQLGTYEKGDGAPEGRYRVTLFWPDRPPGPQAPVDRLGDAYAGPERSGLEATVPKGGGAIPPFEVRKPDRPIKPAPKRRNRPSADGVD